MDGQPPPQGGARAVYPEQVPALRDTFRFHRYPRLTGYATPELLIHEPRPNDEGTVGWMTVHGAVVLIEPGADGVVFIDQHTVLHESTLQRRPVLSRPGVQERDHVLPHPADVIDLDVEAAVVFRPGWHNYFHWLVQYLPMALHSLEVRPEADIVLPRYASFADRPLSPTFSEDTYHASLELILGRTSSVRFLDPGYYRFPVVHVPLFQRPTIFGHGFRDRFFSRLEPLLEPAGGRWDDRRLFITRSGALNRARVAEPVHARMAELADLADFESVDLAAMPWFDQVRAFASASAILAVHGAGLANIVFSSDVTVIEYNQLIRNETSLRDVYFELCRDLGHRYLLIREPDIDHIGPEHLIGLQRQAAPTPASVHSGAAPR